MKRSMDIHISDMEVALIADKQMTRDAAYELALVDRKPAPLEEEIARE